MTADAVTVPPDMAEETVATESDEEVLEAEEVLSRTSASASAHSATHALSATATSSVNDIGQWSTIGLLCLVVAVVLILVLKNRSGKKKESHSNTNTITINTAIPNNAFVTPVV